MHLFWDCTLTTAFLNTIKQHIEGIFPNVNLDITMKEFILGIRNVNIYSETNFIILHIRYYIWATRCNKKIPDYTCFINWFKNELRVKKSAMNTLENYHSLWTYMYSNLTHLKKNKKNIVGEGLWEMRNDTNNLSITRKYLNGEVFSYLKAIFWGQWSIFDNCYCLVMCKKNWESIGKDHLALCYKKLYHFFLLYADVGWNSKHKVHLLYQERATRTAADTQFKGLPKVPGQGLRQHPRHWVLMATHQ